MVSRGRPSRASLYTRLDEALHELNDRFGALGELIARAMYDNLVRFIVPNVAGPARLVPLAALVDKDFSLPALRQAAQRGRLDAIQSPDGTWRSSRKALDAYRQSRRRRT